jgi:hypothetical protein
MRHVLAAALFAAAILATTGSANAKAPPSGFELCGPNSCSSINTFGDAEPLAIDLFYGGGGSSELWSARVPPARFFTIRWSFTTGGAHVGYYVPLLNVFRYVGDPGAATETTTGMVHWIKLGPGARAILERLTSALEPYSAPVPSRVTVGGKPVRDPASYLRLWSVGKPTYTWPEAGFMTIKTTCDLGSPWTDTAATLQISRRGAFLTRDATVYRIPARLARLVRARASLR